MQNWAWTMALKSLLVLRQEKVVNPAIANSHSHEGNPGVDHHHYAEKNAQNEARKRI